MKGEIKIVFARSNRSESESNIYYFRRREAGEKEASHFTSYYIYKEPVELAKVVALLLFTYAFDIGAEEKELFIDVLVTAVNMVEAIDCGGAFGRKSRQHESG